MPPLYIKYCKKETPQPGGAIAEVLLIRGWRRQPPSYLITQTPSRWQSICNISCKYSAAASHCGPKLNHCSVTQHLFNRLVDKWLVFIESQNIMLVAASIIALQMRFYFATNPNNSLFYCAHIPPPVSGSGRSGSGQSLRMSLSSTISFLVTPQQPIKPLSPVCSNIGQKLHE